MLSRITLTDAEAIGRWPVARRLVPIVLTAAIILSIAPRPAAAQNALDALDGVLSLTELETPVDDLIRLATSYSDALRDLKVAQLSIETVRTLRPNAIITNLEVQIAGLNLEAAERKVKILRAIAEKQLSAAEDKLEVISYLEKMGQVNGAAEQRPAGIRNERSYIRVQDEATIAILKMILAMN